MPQGEYDSHWWFGNWEAVSDRDAIYVKIDDDVVFIEDNTIVTIVNRLWDNPQYFAVSANVVNNPALSWVHNRLGVYEPYWPVCSCSSQLVHGSVPGRTIDKLLADNTSHRKCKGQTTHLHVRGAPLNFPPTKARPRVRKASITRDLHPRRTKATAGCPCGSNQGRLTTCRSRRPAR